MLVHLSVGVQALMTTTRHCPLVTWIPFKETVATSEVTGPSPTW